MVGPEMRVHGERIHEASKRFMDTVWDHLEMFAAAYLKETNILPSECELVVQFGIDKITYHFQRKPTGDQYATDGIHDNN